ncbi:MAG: DNA mismatch repair endonuclease MutL [Oscillospiraceae bacterium]|nr:DNA mismatch repair endonuclease MutL [Oscillospiraceae bacterium]
MAKIVKLEQHIADLIAAGEVVSRPASVVKELIENAVDAKAGIITIEIKDGGMTYIRVSDDGCGIAPEYVQTAFLRHATSKIQTERDLEAIETLGFRGEALAAIAAVSRIEIHTRTPDAREGTRLILEAGETLSNTPVGCPAGTTIIVRDLFFNTPARLKFMKTNRAEGSAVSSVVMRAALCRPDISFRFIKDGKTEYHTPGDSLPESCVYNVLGREFQAGQTAVNFSDDGFSVKGFVSKPEASRGNRGYQFLFINGRPVRSLLMQSALEQAYKNVIGVGKFPSCVLYITTKASNVDVNVHPAKTEVRFISDKQVFDAVYYAVLGTIEQLHAQMNLRSGAGGLETYDPDEKKQSGGFFSLTANDYKKSYGGALKVSEAASRGTYGYTPKNTDKYAQKYAQKQENRNFSNLQNSGIPSYSENSLPGQSKLSENDSGAGYVKSLAGTRENEQFRVIGEAQKLYIIIEKDENIWLIDKHAAHERIHYNALKSGEYSPMSEELIVPVICSVGCEQAAALTDNADILDLLGFTAERFGEDTVAVRHIPSDIDISDTESVLSELCQALMTGGGREPSMLDNIYKTLACKAAIKAGSNTSIQEMDALAARVVSGEITHCPHGRPITYVLTKTMLEKGFGRA